MWYADVPNKSCVRVREGGEVLQTVRADRGCFACMLGSAGRKTLFIVATEWRGMDAIETVARERTGLVLMGRRSGRRRRLSLSDLHRHPDQSCSRILARMARKRGSLRSLSSVGSTLAKTNHPSRPSAVRSTQ